MAKRPKVSPDDVAAAEKRLHREAPAIIPPDFDTALSTGSTLLNMACTGRPRCGYVRGNYYYLVGDTNSGKAQPLDAKVLTPMGWALMGSLRPGDDIIDPDGGTAKVLAVYPQGEKQVFRVTMSDGTSTRCCAEHLWLVRNGNDTSRGTTRIRTVGQMCESLDRGENLYLPSVEPVEYNDPVDPLPIDPYLLGVLLGNGHFGARTVMLSTSEAEIVSKVAEKLPDGMTMTQSQTQSHDYGLVYKKGHKNPLLDMIRSLGLADVRAATKFIPRQYLTASVDDRIALLRGLMDTDGTVSVIGAYEYTTASPKLARDIVELIGSLGGIAPMSVKQEPVYSYKGVRKVGQPSYRIRLRTHRFCPFSLSRKAARYRHKMKGGHKRVVGIEMIGTEECQCIAVSSKRRLYVTDGFIVTHNTWLSLACMAEAAICPAYDRFRFIFDNVEKGAQMDLRRHFGKRMAERLEAPCHLPDGLPWHSERIEDFYVNLDTALSRGPCIYVLDSMDALSSKDEQLKFQEVKEEAKGGKPAKGSYGDGKAKKNSGFLRQMLSPLDRTGSILIVISQTRDNIDSFSFETKTRSGGRAPSFYAQTEVWSSVVQKLTKEVRGQKRHIGNACEFHLKRSRYTGHEARVRVPIYFTAGVDDVGSCVDYLVAEKQWPKAEKGGRITSPDFEFAGSREVMVAHIEEENLEDELRSLVAQVWVDVEMESGVERKRRYT